MVTQTALKNHPGQWAEPNAAAAWDRLEDACGVQTVTEAGRTHARQQQLVDRWNAGGAANRPPNLYQPAAVGHSPHEGGDAIDGPHTTQATVDAHPEFGFYRNLKSSDPVHCIYDSSRDQYLHAGGGVSQDVKNQQTAVNQVLNLGLVVDGIRGPKTIAGFKALQNFLRSYGYTGAIDGIWGNGTQAAWERYSTSVAPTTNPTAGGPLSYADIQAGLNKFGYGLVVDNKWGPKSHAALGAFQRSHGLTVDYLVGPKTRAVLGI